MFIQSHGISNDGVISALEAGPGGSEGLLGGMSVPTGMTRRALNYDDNLERPMSPPTDINITNLWKRPIIPERKFSKLAEVWVLCLLAHADIMRKWLILWDFSLLLSWPWLTGFCFLPFFWPSLTCYKFECRLNQCYKNCMTAKLNYLFNIYLNCANNSLLLIENNRRNSSVNPNVKNYSLPSTIYK